jgi:hypothetical protein
MLALMRRPEFRKYLDFLVVAYVGLYAAGWIFQLIEVLRMKQ